MTSHRRWVLAGGLALCVLSGSLAKAEVQNIRGTSKSTVVQFAGVFPIQTDFNQETIPLTKTEPPAAARARLDRLLTDGSITAAGQALSILDNSNPTDGGTPNDVGFDLGAFSDDNFTSWFVEGAVMETRSLQLSPVEVGGQATNGTVSRVRSRVLLSGVMLITAADAGRDLTGARVNLSFSVTLRQAGRPESTPLAGEVTLAGTPGGDATVENPSGALSGVFLPIVDFTDQVVDLPIVRALPFAGINFPYEYDVVVGQPYELELSVRSQVFTVPGGVGAASVFGLPQGQLADVLTRVKGDDRGTKLVEAVSKRVDTTGLAYVDTPVNAPSGGIPLFSACGLLGFESAAACLGCGLAVMFKSGNRRRRGR